MLYSGGDYEVRTYISLIVYIYGFGGMMKHLTRGLRLRLRLLSQRAELAVRVENGEHLAQSLRL